ncbi:MAG: N-acetyl-gamma-glutamyl-phosphate reductase [Alphaproteobacteria bacterium]|nr:N-acetyl-gamma-glutamyl-phosphate reductase [Alphaproteobacteria bacterium]
MTKPSIYIDGEAGTTGLEIRKRLENRADIEILSIAPDRRKDAAARKDMLNACDLAILCLPDDAAREAVAMIENPKTRVLDASTAHRTAPGWVYGFPELTPEQADEIHAAARVANPGCYPTGAIALLRPLVDAGIVPRGAAITVNAVSGYSGGGKELIALCEKPDGSDRTAAFCLYGLDQTHKHLPEMRVYSGLDDAPVFLPSYSSAFYRGMLISVVLHLKDLRRMSGKTADGAAIRETLAARYKGMRNILVEPLQEKLEKTYVLTPLAQNETNNLQLRVFASPDRESVILTACLDNLGKGAAGAAVQNAEIMLGLKGA